MRPTLTFLNLHGSVPCPMATPDRSVLCLGNFDGVHRAHAALLAEGRRLAADLSVAGEAIPCGVFCFFRPSMDYLPRGDGERPLHLTTLRDKLALFAKAGMDFVCLCDFNAVRGLSPSAFTHLLRTSCGCVGAVCGFNYRFGRFAAGTPDDLISPADGSVGLPRVSIMPEMQEDGETVCSSRIRRLLMAGDAETAAKLLGRPYSLHTTVYHGKRLGRTLGFPTANQFFLPESLIPAHGVYVARCHTPVGVFPGVANVGHRPTVEARGRVNCETYILDYHGDLYGKRLRVEFLCRLRGEQKFPDLAALRAAIENDAEKARRYIESHEAAYGDLR